MTPWVLALLSFVFLAAPLAVEAQPMSRVYRIGVVSHGDPPSDSEWQRSTFVRALRELGYVEGQNLAVERRYAEGRLDRLSGYMTDLVQLNVDVIVAATTMTIPAAKQASRTIPIVFYSVVDPVLAGWVISMARPGGNMTGVASIGSELLPKRMELLKEAVPGLTRLALLYGQDVPWRFVPHPRLVNPARSMGVEILPLEVGTSDELEAAFERAVKERSGGLVDNNSPMIREHQERISGLALKNRLPWIGWDRNIAVSGALMSYGENVAGFTRRGANYIAKILKGAKPADLPIEQPTKFDLVINLKTARALGLTIPQSVLLRADEVIQ